MRWASLALVSAIILCLCQAIVAGPVLSESGGTVWGYNYPYSMAYGTGVPYYTGHNNGETSGNFYEDPVAEVPGASDPTRIIGDPENAMPINFTLAFPSMKPLPLSRLYHFERA
ncbi:MAG TPA: hypothetical protein VK436_10590 [Methanocella sp.]|nr:hypothetical protein [Methanocella sp.]